jgi:hypothetical protein
LGCGINRARVGLPQFIADCRSLLAGDLLPAVTDYIPNRLQAGSYTHI